MDKWSPEEMIKFECFDARFDGRWKVVERYDRTKWAKCSKLGETYQTLSHEGFMTCFRGRSESPLCVFNFSNSSRLKYSVCQSAIFWGSISWNPSLSGEFALEVEIKECHKSNYKRRYTFFPLRKCLSWVLHYASGILSSLRCGYKSC